MFAAHFLSQSIFASFAPQSATFVPTTGSEEELVEAALVASAHDDSPAGRAVYRAAAERLRWLAEVHAEEALREDELCRLVQERHAFVREGELAQMEGWVRRFGGYIHSGLRRVVSQVEARGGYAVVVASNEADLGAVCFARRPFAKRW